MALEDRTINFSVFICSISCFVTYNKLNLTKKYMKKILLLLFVLLLFGASTCPNREVHFKKVFSQYVNGKLNVLLDDHKNTIDIVSDTFAIDVEFAPNWATSIGHSLYAATKLNKKAGIVLITHNNSHNKYSHDKYINILMPIANKYNITVWVMNYSDSTWKQK